MLRYGPVTSSFFTEHPMPRRQPLPVFFAITLVTSILALVPRVNAAEEENRPPEMKVLDRWVGEWDMEASIKANDFLPQGSKSTFKTSIAWTVNGRLLRCDAQGQGAQGERKFKDAFSWMITFDPRAKSYTSVVFWANVGGGGDDWGGGQSGAGQWDEKAQTMTIRTVEPNSGIVTSSVTVWADAHTHSFVTTVTDPTGKVMMEMSGKAKRRK
jgi:hypothetical protein